MYRYVFKVDEFDAVVYSEFTPQEAIEAIKEAHDNAHGWAFENQLFLSAGAMRELCMFVEPAKE